SVFEHECRARSDHWSGSSRQGPAVWYDDDDPTVIRAAGLYKDHKRTGRWFEFDKQGRLAQIIDYLNGVPDGAYVTCYPDGSVAGLFYDVADKIQGVSRWWRKDGTLSYAIEYKDDKWVRSLTDDPAQ